jgi:hypothetical protein
MGVRESSRKLEIGAAVQLSQAVQAELADAGCTQLSALLAELLLDDFDDEGEATRVHVALVGGSGQAAKELLPIEGLAGAVPLDHLEDLRNGALIGGEAMPAFGALTAPANGSVGDATGLEGPGGGVAAGAVHSSECSGV